MDCQNCGVCCLDERIPLHETDYVPLVFVDVSNASMKQINNACICFDHGSRACSIYPERPKLCRMFVPGSPECRLTRLWAEKDLGWFGEHPKQPTRGSFQEFCSCSTSPTIEGMIQDLS